LTGVSKVYDSVFLGSKLFGLNVFRAAFQSNPSAKWLVICPDDAINERSVKELFTNTCAELGVDLEFASTRVEAKNLLDQVNAQKALVCGWYWILSQETLQNFPHGVWGIHNSLLPKYRGGSPLVWALIQGERQVGSSLFRLSSELDSGPILGQVSTVVTEEDNVLTVETRLNAQIIEVIRDRWRSIGIEDLTKELREQDHTCATYCGQRIPSDGNINWNQPAGQVHNFIRAQTTPYPRAFTFLGSNKIFFPSALLELSEYVGTPGQVVKIDEDFYWITCGHKSAIRVPKASLTKDGESEPIQLSLKTRLIRSLNSD
jgi:methionyl-tRNA formyltransferase